jgi:hypothetical protein
MPGPLSSLSARLPHALGLIDVELSRRDGRWQGRVALPPGTSGTYSGLDGDRQELTEGVNVIAAGPERS